MKFNQNVIDEFSFNSNCMGFEGSRKFNLMYAQAAQNYFNDLIRLRYEESKKHDLFPIGCVYLNEIYDFFGLPRKPYGQCFGWFYGVEWSDNYIDFGLNPKGTNPVVRIRLNHDGNILEKMLRA